MMTEYRYLNLRMHKGAYDRLQSASEYMGISRTTLITALTIYSDAQIAKLINPMLDQANAQYPQSKRGPKVLSDDDRALLSLSDDDKQRLLAGLKK